MPTVSQILTTGAVLTLLSPGCGVARADGEGAGSPRSGLVTRGGIQAAVAEDLLADPGVNGEGIQVVEMNGEVILSGEVDSLVQWKRAQARVSRVRGARVVHNRLRVRPTVMMPDAEVRAQVHEALAYHALTSEQDVAVSVRDGGVTLQGVVPTHRHRALTEWVAGAVVGVVAISNELRVAAAPSGWAHRVSFAPWPPSPWQTSPWRTSPWRKSSGRTSPWQGEEDIARDVERALADDPHLLGAHVSVQVASGIVRLHGSVRALVSVDAAAEVARTIRGVLQVENHLHPIPVAVADADLARAVSAALARHPVTEAFAIRVSAHQGTVVLRGAVDTMLERSQAYRLTSAGLGVQRVINELEVLQDTSPLTNSSNRE